VAKKLSHMALSKQSPTEPIEGLFWDAYPPIWYFGLIGPRESIAVCNVMEIHWNEAPTVR